MKICFLSSMHSPTDKRVFFKEAVSLAAHGFDVIHLAPGDIKSHKKNGVLLELYQRPKGLINRLFRIPTFFLKAKRIKADVYHCNEVDSWIVGIFLKIFLQKKVLFDVHEHYATNFGINRFPKWAHSFTSGFIRLLFRILIPFTDYFVFAKKNITADFPNTEQKQLFVFNYTHLEYKDKAKKDVPESVKKIFKGKFTAIHIGLFSKPRGWPQLLEAMRRLKIPNFQFISVGEINDGSEQELWETTKEYNLQDKIILKKWMPYSEVYNYLLCSDVGLVLFQPLILNNVLALPHKMFDYMLANLPILIPEFAIEIVPIVKETNCGILIDSAKPESISSALEKLNKDKKQRIQMGKNGRNSVIKQYNWENESKKLIDFYKKMQEDMRRNEN